MPVVHELFGEAVTERGCLRGRFRYAQCPHMAGAQCDGGGNRDMARWPASKQPLAPFFDPSVSSDSGYIPCGVCSVFSNRNWAICPRRLLTFNAGSPSPQQRHLLDRVIHLAGFRSGDEINVWSEISISSRTEDQKLDYRLDYVLKTRKSPPIIVEIMTASTSGGNKRKRTDIQSAFCDAVLFAEGILEKRGRSPGVNIRQVWARMASQMIVKSQIANEWGGRTIWVVQDSLMAYIQANTGLRARELLSPEWHPGEVNVISASIDDPSDVQLYSGPVSSNNGEACWAEMLNTPVVPPVDILSEKLVDENVIARILVP